MSHSDLYKMPLSPRPIYIIGAGSIVQDAHLPAYKKAGWQVAGIYDSVMAKSEELAAANNISEVFLSLATMVQQAPPNAVFDVAVPASALPDVLGQLPQKATVLIQKPFGSNIEEATQLYELCKRKEFTAAINFQKRFIPAIVKAKKMIDEGFIGELHHIEIRMNIWHPWHLWSFLFDIPRMEMLYHSIHYMDLMRYFLGNPKSVYAKTVKHPKMMQLASTRSVIILDYGEVTQAFINTNHGHEFGLNYQDAFIKWEGTNGAIRHTLGKNINFPEGGEDTFEVSILEEGKTTEWQSVDPGGTWYPDAFMGSMANLISYAEGTDPVLINSIESAYHTMQLVEAAYVSSNGGGTPINYKS